MKKEISREIIDGQIRVTYDDGSTEMLVLPEPPQNVVVESDQDPSINKGHIFEQ